MTTSIKDIARNASEAAKVAMEAVKIAEEANITVTSWVNPARRSASS
jgi:methyl-accepting chemotaxis protein